MAGPNKLLMGIASLLGASLKRKREKADYLERLGLSQAYRQEEWDRQNKIRQEERLRSEAASIKEYDRRYDQGRKDAIFDHKMSRNDAINTMLAKGGYRPEERDIAFARRRLATEREELVAQGLDEKKTQKLFRTLEPVFDTMEPYLKETLSDSENYYPELHTKGKSDHRNSFLAMQKMQEIISGGLRAEGFPLADATMLAEQIAPDFARQAFGPQSNERRLSGIDLIRGATTP